MQNRPLFIRPAITVWQAKPYNENAFTHLAELTEGRRRVVNACAYIDGQRAEMQYKIDRIFLIPTEALCMELKNIKTTVLALNEQIVMFDRFIRNEKWRIAE
jgi:hypothetical protein